MGLQPPAPVVRVTEVPRIEPGAVIHEQLNDAFPSLVRSAMQRGAPGVPLGVRIEPEIQEQLHGLHVGCWRPLIRQALDPADAGRRL